MKGKLIRVCVVANDAAETMRDFNDLLRHIGPGEKPSAATKPFGRS